MDIERDIDLDSEVATHGTDTAAIGVFEATEVRLISLIEEVLADNRDLNAVVTTKVNICAEREVTDGIVRGGGLSVFEGEEMVLPEVILHAESNVRTTKMVMEEVRQFVAKVEVPARSRNHREIVHIAL